MIVDVAIVGGGFAGLGLATLLAREGRSFLVLEAKSEPGGVWRDNHYPGVACDIESQLYSYSFSPNPDWSRTYAPQREIYAYLRRHADALGDRLWTDAPVTAATWEPTERRWRIETSMERVVHARALVSASGLAFHQPVVPELPGFASFRGATFHSARWDHSVPLAGRRVAVIGTGASAIQIVPAIAPQVASLTVFQRTAPWIVPRGDREVPTALKALFRRAPATQRALRAAFFARHELLSVALTRKPELMRYVERATLKELHRAVRDPVLRDKLTPRYRMGCKRILLSDDYYEALTRPNVEVTTHAIAEITASGLRTSDGAHHEVDAIVFATGFEAANASPPFAARGTGATWDELWKRDPSAYLGTTIRGLPNFFLLVGPNTGLGHNSMIAMMEAQFRYLRGAFAALDEVGAVELREDAQRRYNDWLEQRLARTVWASGCQSWYLSKSGRNTTMWPGSVLEFRHRTRRFDLENYETVA